MKLKNEFIEGAVTIEGHRYKTLRIETSDDGVDGCVACTFGDSEAESLTTAKLIVKSVNMHDQLVEIVELLTDVLIGYYRVNGWTETQIEKFPLMQSVGMLLALDKAYG